MNNRFVKPNPYVLTAIFVLVIFIVICLISPLLFPIDLGATDLTNRLQNPILVDTTSKHLLGTDQLGRDVLIRLFYAARTTIIISFIGMIGASMLGIALGMLAGYFGGIYDKVISLITEAFITVPTTFVGIIVATIAGANPLTTVLVIILSGWAPFCRITRGQVMQVRNEAFIESSKVIGLSNFKILFNHILPNIASAIIVHMTTSLSGFILLESTLSFLGLGIQPPNTSLGIMVSEGRDFMLTHWWLAITPSLVMVLLIFSITIIGDWLRDSLDPKLRNIL